MLVILYYFNKTCDFRYLVSLVLNWIYCIESNYINLAILFFVNRLKF